MKKDAEEGTNIHAETSDTHLTYRWLRRTSVWSPPPMASVFLRPPGRSSWLVASFAEARGTEPSAVHAERRPFGGATRKTALNGDEHG